LKYVKFECEKIRERERERAHHAIIRKRKDK
jgi:hypothetical protein